MSPIGLGILSASANRPTVSIDFLIVAGGGGGGVSPGGGGGGGGYLCSVAGEQSGGPSSPLNPLGIVIGRSYTVTVGAGGGQFADGSNSVFASLTAIGGGKGGGSTSGNPAGTGGSGGGSEAISGASGGLGTTGQGNNGGTGSQGANFPATYATGGGGGAGAAGSTSNGGNGLTSSITGSAVTRAGGGGGANATYRASGGSGGGGLGTFGDLRFNADAFGSAGVANTGGGGGGGYTYGGATESHPGGSGIVILRYPSTYTITLGAGLTGTTATVGGNKVTTVTAGTGQVSFT